MFNDDTKNHVMTCIKTDGLHRHYRFAEPNNSCYWFDIITTPGYLFMTGDMGTWTFSRIADMIKFFNKDKPNYGYWAEKLQIGPCRSGASNIYSEVDLSATLKNYHKSLQYWFSSITEEEYDKDTLKAIKESYREFARRLSQLNVFAADYSYSGVSTSALWRAIDEVGMCSDSIINHSSPWDYEDLSPVMKPTSNFVWACDAINYACKRIAIKEIAEKAMDKFLVMPKFEEDYFKPFIYTVYIHGTDKSFNVRSELEVDNVLGQFGLGVCYSVCYYNTKKLVPYLIPF